MHRLLLLVVIAAIIAGCSRSAPVADPAPGGPATTTTSPAGSASASAGVIATSLDGPEPRSSSAPAPSSRPPPPPPLPACARRLASYGARSIAVGKKRIAGLIVGDSGPYVKLIDGLGTGRDRTLPLSPAARRNFDASTLDVYFGRDDWPRLMGFDPTGDQPTSLYFRWRPAKAWHRATFELGRLATPGGDLWGVLGHDDPEVVCRSNVTCVLKRRTGWTNAPAPSRPMRVVLSHGKVWGLDGVVLVGLEPKGFMPVADHGPGQLDDAATVDGTAWVVSEAGGVVSRLEDGKFVTVASLAGARGVTASRDGGAFVAARDGVFRVRKGHRPERLAVDLAAARLIETVPMAPPREGVSRLLVATGGGLHLVETGPACTLKRGE